jgi:hypothetical protein
MAATTILVKVTPIDSTLFKKALRQANVSVIIKWLSNGRVVFDETRFDDVNSSFVSMAETCKHKMDFTMLVIILDAYPQIKMTCTQWSSICKEGKWIDFIKKCINNNRHYPNSFSFLVLFASPPIQDLFISVMTEEQKNEALHNIDNFSMKDSDHYLVAADKLIKAGANMEQVNEHCGTTLVETCHDRDFALVLLQNGAALDLTRLLNIIMYKFIIEFNVSEKGCNLHDDCGDECPYDVENKTRHVLAKYPTGKTRWHSRRTNVIAINKRWTTALAFFKRQGHKFDLCKTMAKFGCILKDNGIDKDITTVIDDIENDGIGNVVNDDFDNELVVFDFTLSPGNNNVPLGEINYNCWWEHYGLIGSIRLYLDAIELGRT